MLNIWRLSYDFANKGKNPPFLQSSLESTVVSLKQKWNTEQEHTFYFKALSTAHTSKTNGLSVSLGCVLFFYFALKCQMAFDTLQSKQQTQDPSAGGTPKILVLTQKKKFCILCSFCITLFNPFFQIAKVLNTTHTTTGLQGNQFLWCSAGKNL